MLNTDVELLLVTAGSSKQKKELWAILRDNMAAYLKEIIKYDKPLSVNESLDELVSMNLLDCSQKYLVYVSGTCCGFIDIVPTLTIEDEKVTYIRHLYIKEEFRRKGYGELVIDKIMTLYPLPWVLENLKQNGTAKGFWQHYCSNKDLRLKNKSVKLKSRKDIEYYSLWCDIMEILPNTEK